MTTFDCADPTQIVAKRGETLTALQALALMNNPLMVRMFSHMADRVKGEAPTLPEQINRAFALATGRTPTPEEQEQIVGYARTHGLANACRLIINLNEFMFVD